MVDRGGGWWNNCDLVVWSNENQIKVLVFLCLLVSGAGLNNEEAGLEKWSWKYQIVQHGCETARIHHLFCKKEKEIALLGGTCLENWTFNIGVGKLAGMQMVDFLINQPINEKIRMEYEFLVGISSEAPTHIFEECFQYDERKGRPWEKPPDLLFNKTPSFPILCFQSFCRQRKLASWKSNGQRRPENTFFFSLLLCISQKEDDFLRCVYLWFLIDQGGEAMLSVFCFVEQDSQPKIYKRCFCICICLN